jgi:hypothetical protein
MRPLPWLGLLGLLGACAATPCKPEAGDVLPVAMLGGHPLVPVVLHDARICTGPGDAWAEAAGTLNLGTLPLTITPQGLLLVRVVANGQPMRALFDTGAAITVMRQGVATRAGVPEAVLARPVDGWASGIGPATPGVRRHLLPELRVGEEVLRDVPVGIVETSWDLPFEMVLGMDYMAPRRFWISYARQRLHVQRSGAEAWVPAVGRAPAAVP